MRTNIFNTAVALSDSDLLARTRLLAADEREATAELVAHLAALEMRPSAYAAAGHGSLFGYCTAALGLSEDAACTRIAAARWCGQFPVIADLMAAGTVSLTAVRLVGPHLTAENHQAVLARAAHLGKTEVRELVAALAPQPDVPASVRKLSASHAKDGVGSPNAPDDRMETLWTEPTTSGDESSAIITSTGRGTGVDLAAGGPGASVGPPPTPVPTTMSAPSAEPAARETMVGSRPGQRPLVRPLAPDRYRVQFTMGRQAYDELRQVQALLRREIRDGDAGLVFERALHLLLEQVKAAKLGTRSGRRRKAIRSGTDRPSAPVEGGGKEPDDVPNGTPMTPNPRSRHIPAAVRAAVWDRDGARCAFASREGQRCSERAFLEFHHLRPYALDGPSTVDNIALRCHRHNQYEGELEFGPRLSQHITTAGP